MDYLLIVQKIKKQQLLLAINLFFKFFSNIIVLYLYTVARAQNEKSCQNER